MRRLITLVSCLFASVVCAAQPEQAVNHPGQTILELRFEVRSDAPADDFDPYLKISVTPAIRKAWVGHVPYTAQPPLMKRGTLAVEFKIQSNGSIDQVRVTSSSGDEQLDRGVLSALKEASPLAAMPEKLRGRELSVRGVFTYNPDRPTKLIPTHDLPSLFLPHELRIGVKLEDETQWPYAGAYIEAAIAKVRLAWYSQIKEIHLPSGATLTSIRILIQPDGATSETTVTHKSGSTTMDAAAIAALASASPLPALPATISKPLTVQLNFQYEPDTNATQPDSK